MRQTWRFVLLVSMTLLVLYFAGLVHLCNTARTLV